MKNLNGSNEQQSATAKQVQINIKKAAISEYKHCKSIHFKEGKELNSIFTFYADNPIIQDKLMGKLKENGFSYIWSSSLHSKPDAFLLFGTIGVKLNLKSFIKISIKLFKLANEVGAEYLYFEIAEVQEYYSNGQYEADLELQEAFCELQEEGDLPF